MLIHIFYTLNLLLLFSCLLIFRLKTGERRVSLSVVQALLGLPLLAGEYLYLTYYQEQRIVLLLLFSESVFALVWFYMAHRLCRETVTTAIESRLSLFIQIFIGIVVAAPAGYCLICRPAIQISDERLIFDHYGLVYFCAIFLLVSMLGSAWHLEEFWRTLDKARRWEYKFLVVGGYLICGALGWAASYRITYLRLIPNHFLLLAVLLLLAWFLMCYAVARHRLLNRKMFISRKVVYSFVPHPFLPYIFVPSELSP